ncbi:hypothetical protein [Bradyrhizobium guangzhouense]|uniref:hypothetical protein n=1 Tax=Bradyrhizobium guangzhouense TaxID=1325095 RepID=UPI001009AF50|nr:hypothetical protein [Bradyrhizobium guangzhouense]RXH20773.1 hypothetical protein EAS54_02235 [Bradyrhizobium guangzhouense]
MITPLHLGLAGPLWRAQASLHARVFGRFTCLELTAVDLRLAIATVVARSLVQAADALVSHVMGRAWRGARFAEDITAAATMVAAARH